MPPELSAAYQHARLLVVVSAGLTVLWRLGIPLKGRLPLLDIDLATGAAVLPQVLPFVLAYGIFRLVIEWTQSALARRKHIASRLDFSVTLLLGIAAFVVLGLHFLPAAKFSWAVVIPSVALMTLGLATGLILSTVLTVLPMIRSKETARRLALPRVPVAVRALWKAWVVVVPAMALVVFLSPSFSSPVSRLWPWLLAVPVLVSLLSGAIELSLPRRTLRDGSVLSRREYFARLRPVFDVHDAQYQQGGWDYPIPPANSPLYEAAVGGDHAAVSRLLDAGADPNEPNQHGWTAVMIAVANQHAATVDLLLARGADPNRGNLFGRTPLMFAARYGNLRLTETLLDHGARLDVSDRTDSDAALFAAARSRNVDLVQRLLAAGADPTVADRHGLYPDQHAERVGDGEAARVLRRARLERDQARPAAD